MFGLSESIATIKWTEHCKLRKKSIGINFDPVAKFPHDWDTRGLLKMKFKSCPVIQKQSMLWKVCVLHLNLQKKVAKCRENRLSVYQLIRETLCKYNKKIDTYICRRWQDLFLKPRLAASKLFLQQAQSTTRIKGIKKLLKKSRMSKTNVLHIHLY